MMTPVLDHLVLDVHADMEAAAAQYRALGFTLTERGYHTLGSINHLAMFETDYLELLGWPAEGSGRAELLRFPRGLNGLVFKTEDADATYAQLQAAGLAGDAPRAFSRPVAIDGVTRDAKFRTVYVAAEKSLLPRIYFCEHATPELVWRPEWQQHANGVRAIDSVVVEATDPAAMAAMFRAMFGDAVRAEGAGFVVAAGRPRIEIVGGARDAMVTLRLKGQAGAAVEAGGVRLEFVG